MSCAYLQCVDESCRRKQPGESDAYLCPACGGLLEVNYDFPPLDPDLMRRTWLGRRASCVPLDRSGVWRFRELLPFLEPDADVVTLAEGSTPLLDAPAAARWAGVHRLAVKHQGANPTGSFKDLGMTACMSRARSQGVRVVACASTGNTSSSMAAYASRAGMRALLFVPYRQITPAKLAQALDFGAFAVEVGDTFDQAFELLRSIAPELRLYLVNSVNPFRLEGQKTVVAEMLEQRGWRPPDSIIVPGGNLGNSSAIGKGLRELRELGFIDRLPRLVVIQAEGANPFYRTLAAGSSDLLAVEEPRTEATAIRIGRPANWKKARQALQMSNGFCEQVNDEEIAGAKRALAADGIGCEPASATTIAGVRKLARAGKLEPRADLVCVLTGHQLKDTDFVMRHEAEGRRLHVDPSPEALKRALAQLLA